MTVSCVQSAVMTKVWLPRCVFRSSRAFSQSGNPAASSLPHYDTSGVHVTEINGFATKHCSCTPRRSMWLITVRIQMCVLFAWRRFACNILAIRVWGRQLCLKARAAQALGTMPASREAECKGGQLLDQVSPQDSTKLVALGLVAHDILQSGERRRVRNACPKNSAFSGGWVGCR